MPRTQTESIAGWAVPGLTEMRAVRPEFADWYSDDAPCWVYEVWDTSNRLVYVGIADDFPRRWRQHRNMSWWLGEVQIDHIHLEGFASREYARWTEAAVINQQSPVYNTNPETNSYHAYLAVMIDPDFDIPNDYRPIAKKRFVPDDVNG